MSSSRNYRLFVIVVKLGAFQIIRLGCVGEGSRSVKRARGTVDVRSSQTFVSTHLLQSANVMVFGFRPIICKMEILKTIKLSVLFLLQVLLGITALCSNTKEERSSFRLMIVVIFHEIRGTCAAVYDVQNYFRLKACSERFI